MYEDIYSEDNIDFEKTLTKLGLPPSHNVIMLVAYLSNHAYFLAVY